MDFFLGLCYKEIGNTYDYSDLFMTIVGGTYSILSGVMRIFWGWVDQKKGFKVTLTLIILGSVNYF